MDIPEQVVRFREFIEKNYLAELKDNLRKDKKMLAIDFNELSKFDNELGDLLLELPMDTISAAELSLEQLDLDKPKEIKIRFFNLPESCNVLIQHIRSEHLGKFLSIEGNIFSMSTIRPLILSSKFECPSCGNIINIVQLDDNLKEPSRCGCGRKGKFNLLGNLLTNACSIILEECPENSSGTNLAQIHLLLKYDLTSKENIDRIYQGLRVKVNGVLRELFVTKKTGVKSAKLEWYFETNFISIFSEDYTTINISDSDELAIKEFAQNNNVIEEFANRLFYSVYGRQQEKYGLLLCAFGGVKKDNKLGMVRGDSHCLLIGDPSTAKSKLAEILYKVVPKGRYFSCGKKTSDAGLTGACVKDDLLNAWTIKAGALSMANKGIAVADELNALPAETYTELNEALERQIISINKVARGELKSECSFIGVANPKHGRFDIYDTISEQINLPPPLLSRFDLIFLFKMQEDEDDGVVKAIMHSMKHGLSKADEEFILFFKKYMTRAKRINPVLTEEAEEYITNKYIEIKKVMTVQDTYSYTNVPITPRDLGSIIRLTEAYARMKLLKKAGIEEAKFAFGIKMYSLSKTAYDPKTGRLDVMRIETGETMTDAILYKKMEHILKQKTDGSITITLDELQSLLQVELGKEYIDKDDIIKIIDKMKTKGEVYEPRYGHVTILR